MEETTADTRIDPDLLKTTSFHMNACTEVH